MAEHDACRICGSTEARQLAAEPPYQPRTACPACGEFRLSERAAQALFEEIVAHAPLPARGRALPREHHLLSAVVRERYEAAGRQEVFIPDFGELRSAARPLAGGPLEAADRVLAYVAEHATRIGAVVQLTPAHDYPVAFARDAAEFKSVVELATSLALVESRGVPTDVAVAPGGWRRLQELRANRRSSRQAFVAMAFAADMTEAYVAGIEPALRACGYTPLRVDREEYNDRIDDRIVAGIRKSGLLVADVTKQRNGVYFEAGFAMGLGLPVIWTCRADDLENVHFDTRQYNHVVWSTPTELLEKLQLRIEATQTTYPPVA